MEGYLVKFFTQKNREHNGVPLARWIVEEAQKLGVRGATLFSGQEGFGHDGCYHTESFFDFQDPPVQVDLALSFEECDKLMARLEANNLRVFYTKSKIQFGYTSER